MPKSSEVSEVRAISLVMRRVCAAAVRFEGVTSGATSGVALGSVVGREPLRPWRNRRRPLRMYFDYCEYADMLNVSRPHLIELLEAGRIKFRRVGTHRRVRVSELIAYQDNDRIERNAALDALTDEAEKLKLGY